MFRRLGLAGSRRLTPPCGIMTDLQRHVSADVLEGRRARRPSRTSEGPLRRRYSMSSSWRPFVSRTNLATKRKDRAAKAV